jgi:hypothetical protein
LSFEIIIMGFVMRKRLPIIIVSSFLPLALFVFMGMGGGFQKKVNVVTTSQGHYQLMVDEKPFIIKGVCYNPVPIGENHEFDFWSDTGQPWIVDGELMKKMGVNTVRFYQPGTNMKAVRKVVSDLFQNDDGALAELLGLPGVFL